MVKVQTPKLYDGYYHIEAPKIKSDGLRIATVLELVKLKQAGFPKSLGSHDSYSTSTGIAYAGDFFDRFKIISSSQALRDITPEAQFCDGGRRLISGEYEEILAPEFLREDLISGELSFKQAPKHEGLLALFEDPEVLFNLCKENDTRRIRDSVGKRELIMGFRIRELQEFPNLRPITFNTHPYQTFSGFSDKYGLEDNVLLVGV